MRENELQLDGCIVEATTEFNRVSTSKMYEYWSSICDKSPDIGPQHTDFELTDIIECTPFIMYKDVIDSGYDFRNRYWGTEIALAFSHEATGKSLREYYGGEPLKQVLEVSNFVISGVHAVKILGKLKFVDNYKFSDFEAIYLPLFDNSGSPSRFVALYDFFV